MLGPGNPKQFFFSWLTSYLYFLSLALGALFFVLIQYATQGGWFIVVRRIGETAFATIPVNCSTPLAEERPYWERYFDLLKVQDAHARSRCRDLNGSESWACDNCDCTARLEEKLAGKGQPFRR